MQPASICKYILLCTYENHIWITICIHANLCIQAQASPSFAGAVSQSISQHERMTMRGLGRNESPDLCLYRNNNIYIYRYSINNTVRKAPHLAHSTACSAQCASVCSAWPRHVRVSKHTIYSIATSKNTQVLQVDRGILCVIFSLHVPAFFDQTTCSPGTPAPRVFIYMKLLHGWCYASNGVVWGCVGMITFLALAHMVGATQHHVSCTCTHCRCYATSCFLHLHILSVLRNIMFLALAHFVGATQHHVSCTCTHVRCYATSCFLHLHTWSVLRNIMFLALAHMVGATQHHVSCTCAHGRCYATSCFLHLHTWSVLRNIIFLALAHMVGATQHHVSCTCTHGRCYATSCFLHLHTWSVLRNIMFLALEHMVGATQHHVSCTCTHGRCYATSCFLLLHTWSVLRNIMFLALAHMVGATQHHFSCTCTHGRCYATACSLHLHTLQFFSCSNSLRLPVHYDTSSKNTVAHSPFEHLDHHDISKIVILPHKSHVSHKYKCMNDGFFINQRADQKKSSAHNTILCRKWLLQKLTFHHNEITFF